MNHSNFLPTGRTKSSFFSTLQGDSCFCFWNCKIQNGNISSCKITPRGILPGNSNPQLPLLALVHTSHHRCFALREEQTHKHHGWVAGAPSRAADPTCASTCIFQQPRFPGRILCTEPGHFSAADPADASTDAIPRLELPGRLVCQSLSLLSP